MMSSMCPFFLGSSRACCVWGIVQRHPESLVDKAGVSLERAMGIEPTSLAWEARVMAIIRRPQSQQFYRVFGGLGMASFWMLA